MKTRFGPKKIMFPLPTSLVVTGNMENANIVTIAWVTLLTSQPPTLGISVGTKGFSGEVIKKNQDFTVNIASARIMTEADFCGITSGKDVDKFERSGLTKMPSSIVQSPIIKECPLNFECRLQDTHLVGKTNQFVGEIMECHVDTDKLKDDEDIGSIDIAAFDPLIYFGAVREYRRVGKKIGDAYQVGKQIRDNMS